MRYLIVDDMRSVTSVMRDVVLQRGGESLSIELVRTFDEGYASLSKSLVEGAYDFLLLDHDLGEERSGYELLLTILDECHDESGNLNNLAGNLPDTIICVSDNPPGRTSIESLIRKVSAIKREINEKEGRV